MREGGEPGGWIVETAEGAVFFKMKRKPDNGGCRARIWVDVYAACVQKSRHYHKCWHCHEQALSKIVGASSAGTITSGSVGTFSAHHK